MPTSAFVRRRSQSLETAFDGFRVGSLNMRPPNEGAPSLGLNKRKMKGQERMSRLVTTVGMNCPNIFRSRVLCVFEGEHSGCS